MAIMAVPLSHCWIMYFSFLVAVTGRQQFFVDNQPSLFYQQLKLSPFSISKEKEQQYDNP